MPCRTRADVSQLEWRHVPSKHHAGHVPTPTYRSSESSRSTRSQLSNRPTEASETLALTMSSCSTGSAASSIPSSVGMTSSVTEPAARTLQSIPEFTTPAYALTTSMATSQQEAEQLASIVTEREQEEAAADEEMKKLQLRHEIQSELELIGAAHGKVQARWGIHLATDEVGPTLTDISDPAVSPPPPRPDQSTTPSPPPDASYATASDEDEGDVITKLTGWVTLVKDGVKLVSSRLKLDAGQRAQHKGMWERRVGRNPLAHKPGVAALRKRRNLFL